MPATSRMPPIVTDQVSNEPSLTEWDGLPAAIQALMSVSIARTNSARFSLAHAARSGCLNPLRFHGRSTRGSIRTRMQRRVNSKCRFGLLAVISHSALLGKEAITDLPSLRSVHRNDVSTEASEEECSGLRSLAL